LVGWGDVLIDDIRQFAKSFWSFNGSGVKPSIEVDSLEAEVLPVSLLSLVMA
jgi:hypothetical protein